MVSRDGTLGALYILRNPLDVAPSAANHWHCSLEKAVENLCSPKMAFCRTRKALPPQVRQRIGTWSDHVLSWVDAPHLKVEVIRYEDMFQFPLETFTRAVRFLNLPDDPDRVSKAIRFSDFLELSRQESEKGFRERPGHTERFFREGQTGKGRSQLTQKQVEQLIEVNGETMKRFGYL